jgi:fibronectin-binding autotransporter adhesin
VDTTGGDISLTGILSGNGALTKAGTGTLTLTRTNTYAGATVINAGTLTLGGINTNTVRYEVFSNAYLNVTTPGLTLAPGQELKGGGTVLGSVVAGTNTFLSPGNSIGTLTITSNLTLQSGVKLNFDLFAPGASDLVIVSNQLSWTGLMETNWFVLTAPSGLSTGTYTLFQSVSRVGSLGSATNFYDIAGQSGYEGYLFLEGNNVRLEVVPEPGAGMLVTGGLLTLLLLRRRRNGCSLQ